jgi:hypothetical protein
MTNTEKTSTPVAAPVAKPVFKVAVKAPAAPVVKAPIAKASQAAKPAAKAPLKSSAKTAKKPAAKPASKAAPKPSTSIAKPVKVKKIKMVRDSMSIPKAEYEVLEVLKLRAVKMANPVKKTELIRAGIKAIAAMQDSAFLAAIKAVPSLKTGRPAKAK